MELLGYDVTYLLYSLAVMAVISLALATLFLIWVLWRVKHVDIPPNADFMTAMRATPLSVVILLDLLDFGLDFLSAPISWIILNKLGLQPLRGFTMVESLLPGTNLLPTMTVSWIVSRLMR